MLPDAAPLFTAFKCADLANFAGLDWRDDAVLSLLNQLAIKLPYVVLFEVLEPTHFEDTLML